GAGDEAARMAGRLKHPGTFIMLLPRELDPGAARSDGPPPTARPRPFTLSFGALGDPPAPGPADRPPPEPQPHAQPRTKPGTKPAGASASSNGRSSKSTANSAASPPARQRR